MNRVFVLLAVFFSIDQGLAAPIPTSLDIANTVAVQYTTGGWPQTLCPCTGNPPIAYDPAPAAIPPGARRYLVIGNHRGDKRHPAQMIARLSEIIGEIKADPNHELYNFISNSWITLIPIASIWSYDNDVPFARDPNGINRNPATDYIDVCDPTAPAEHLDSTVAIANFIRQNNFHAAVSVGEVSGSLTFPWGIPIYPDETADYSSFLVAATDATATIGYSVGTHSSQFNPRRGSFSDWAYWEKAIWSAHLTMDSQAVPGNYDEDALAVLRFFKSLPTDAPIGNIPVGACWN